MHGPFGKLTAPQGPGAPVELNFTGTRAPAEDNRQSSGVRNNELTFDMTRIFYLILMWA